MTRFSDRNLRLTRQRESAVFGSIIMPASTMIGFIGVLVMVIVLLDYWLNLRWEPNVFTFGVIAAALPVLSFLFRLARGHFNRELKKT
jgi:hypothetical protein